MVPVARDCRGAVNCADFLVGVDVLPVLDGFISGGLGLNVR